MKEYLYDYNRTYFLEKRDGNKKKYYFKIDKQLIEVSNEVFTVVPLATLVLMGIWIAVS